MGTAFHERVAYIKAAGAIQRAVRCATDSFESVRFRREGKRSRGREKARERKMEVTRERKRERERERERREAAGASAVMIVALETRFH